MTDRLLRLPAVMDATGLGATSIYVRAQKGLFTKPIKLTRRSSAWPESEVSALNQAVIEGRSDADLRTLVKQLVAARRQRSAA